MSSSIRKVFLKSLIPLCLLAIGSGFVLTAKANSHPVLFSDTYSRNDGTPDYDSIGITEVGNRNYKEIGGIGGLGTIGDFARIVDSKLIIGSTANTDPAWVEIENAGYDYDLEVDAEFLSSTGIKTINDIAFIMRNSGRYSDWIGDTIFTRGAIMLDFEQDGVFSVRGFPVGGDSTIVRFEIGTVSQAAFDSADLDENGILELGEPFSLHITLDGNLFSFEFNGVSQTSDRRVDLGVSLPANADTLIMGRSRTGSGVGVSEVQFDNLTKYGWYELNIPLVMKSD